MNNLKHIILFDAQCNFCNFWVGYILKRDRRDIFHFSPLSSETGKNLLQQYQINPTIDTIVLIEGKKYFIKSTAALRILKSLAGLNIVFYGLIILPAFIRDFIYDIVAKYRYKWFGKSECEFIPHSEIKHKFLDS